MSSKTRPAYYDPKGVIIDAFDPNVGLISEGPTVPVDGTTGYAPGALFFKRGGAAGAQLYINEGTKVASAFRATSANGRIATGEVALGGAGTATVNTGLNTITSAQATLKRTTSLATGTAFVTVDFTGSNGTLTIYGWVQAGTASSGTETVEWFAKGT